MDAFTAIPILEGKLTELESSEPSWKNCRACPFSGKCCDGASLNLFPEEKAAISDYLGRNPDVLRYALPRFKQGKKCYFYDKESSKCLIHEVRPLNCRWTPHAAFREEDGRHSVHVRDNQCNFTKKIVSPLHTTGSTITLSPEDITPGANKTYISWQSISELHPLMERAHEMEPLENLMADLTFPAIP